MFSRVTNKVFYSDNILHIFSFFLLSPHIINNLHYLPIWGTDWKLIIMKKRKRRATFKKFKGNYLNLMKTYSFLLAVSNGLLRCFHVAWHMENNFELLRRSHIVVSWRPSSRANRRLPFRYLLYQDIGEGATPLPGFLHFNFCTKYHFLSLWYDSTWDWTQVSRAIGKYFNHHANVQYLTVGKQISNKSIENKVTYKLIT